MSRPDGRIEKGQRLTKAISARAWNRAQDAADIVLGVRPEAAGGAMTPIDKAANVVLVRNTTGQAVPMLGVMMIDSVAIDPSGGTLTGGGAADARAREFVRAPVLTTALPTTDTTRVFVIALEPLGVNAIGRAAISGTIPVKVEIVNTTHRFAVMRDGDVTQLRTAACGPMQLAWKESGTGMNRWALGVM